MRSLGLAVVLLICAFAPADAADPAWVGAINAAEVPGFPASRWLVGLGQEALRTGEAEAVRARAVAQAQAELARSIRTRVVATDSHHYMSELRSGAGERFQERFAGGSSTISDVELTGLRTEVCQRPDAIYALAAVERAALIAHHQERAAKQMAEAEACAVKARALQQAGRLSEAQDAWARVIAPLTEAAADCSLLSALGATPQVAAALAAVRTEAATALAQLAARPVVTVDDLADLLARYLVAQVTSKTPLLITPLTVRDTRIPSPFGRAFAGRLSVTLGRMTWPVVGAERFQEGPARERARLSGAEAVLLGSVWPQADGGAQVMVEAIALATGVRLGVAEARLPASGVAAAGEPLAPENASQALADQQAFATNEVLAQGLTLDLWTNKGDDAQLFTAGETMTVFVRVDRPCHLRLVYHLATGERVLLLDDRFIDESKVNRVYQLPETFECVAPFGAETLQANASNAPFTPLATAEMKGYTVIRDDLATQLAKTRGMRVKTAGVPQIAEARVVLTTVPGTKP